MWRSCLCVYRLPEFCVSRLAQRNGTHYNSTLKKMSGFQHRVHKNESTFSWTQLLARRRKSENLSWKHGVNTHPIRLDCRVFWILEWHHTSSVEICFYFLLLLFFFFFKNNNIGVQGYHRGQGVEVFLLCVTPEWLPRLENVSVCSEMSEISTLKVL